MFEPFHRVVTNVSKTIFEHEEKLGRPVIGVMPAYFPMELIWAAGGYPVQLWGNNLPLVKSNAYLQAYCCSVARSVLELEMRGIGRMVRAYAFTSLCDTLINLREIYRRLFSKPTLELSIPITRTLKARRSYLNSVVANVTDGLQAITATKITPEGLTEASQLYGRVRALQRKLYHIRRETPGLMKNHDFYTVMKAGFFLPAGVYGPMLENLLTDLEKHPAPKAKRPRVLLSGMVFDPLEIYKLMDELGVHVVDDDFANGWRTVAKGDLSTGNLIEDVTGYLFQPAPCCCVYNPNNDRHAYLFTI